MNDSQCMERPEIVKCCEELLARDPTCLSPHLYITLIDSLVEKVRKTSDDQERSDFFAKANEV